MFILFYALPITYHTYKVSPFIEYDQHLIVLTISIGSLIFLWCNKFNFSSLIINSLSDFQILFITTIIFVLILHIIVGIEDNVRWLQSIFCLIILLYLLRYSLNNYHKIIKYLYLLFLPILYESIKGIIQFLTNNNDFLSVKGTLINSGTLGSYISSFLPLIFGWALDQYYNYKQLIGKKTNTFFPIVRIYISVIILSIATICLFLTYARAAWIGFIVSLFIIIISFYKQYNYSKLKLYSYKFRLMYILTIISIIFILFFIFYFKMQSIYGRWQIYKIDLLIIEKNPIFGIGLGNLRTQFNEYQALYFTIHSVSIDKQLLATNTFEAFNIILQLIAEIGIFGLLIITSFIIIHLNILKNNWLIGNLSIIQLSAIASFIGIIITSFFQILSITHLS